jgi:cytochrome c2
MQEDYLPYHTFAQKDSVCLVLATAVAALLMAALYPAHLSAQQEADWLPAEPLKGRMVFEDKHCTRCHSIAGTGGDIGPDLAESYFDGTFLDLASVFWNHVPDMIVEYKRVNLTWPQFTDDDVTHLISYLYYLRYLGAPGSAEKGRGHLQSKGCFSCHNVGGEEGGDQGPELDRLKRYASPIYVIQAIWNHGPEMQDMMNDMGIARPTFTGEEIDDIGAYIRAVSVSTMRERIYLSPGDPNDGKLVFAQKRCDGCHSVHGVGGTNGPAMDDADLSMSATGIAAIMWNHGVEMLSTMQQERIEWPTFDGKEMADLIAYLYFVQFIDPPGDASRGQALFEEKQCVSCHSIKGAGGELGPDLAERLSAHTASVTVLTTMINHAAKMSEKVLSKGKKWPALTGQEMRDIFTYLGASVEKDVTN